MPRAFITGITGQDGSYLCEWLLEHDYEVHGLVHRPDTLAASNISHLVGNPAIMGKQLFLHNGAYEDATHLRRIISRARPNEFYHLAGQSSPRLSLELPESTVDSIGMATLRLLEILRDLPDPPKFLYASSSEVFGSPPHSPQDELTPLNPTTPYGAAKGFSQQMARIYRIAYGLQTCAVILYNHESPRRPEIFVARKIAVAVARIALGQQDTITLGNIDVHRDWGYAPDYVDAMIRILSQPMSDDFIVATGVSHTVREFVAEAFSVAGVSDWQDRVIIDPGLYRPADPKQLVGDPTRLRSIGWAPSVTFHELVGIMITAELERLSAAP